VAALLLCAAALGAPSGSRAQAQILLLPIGTFEIVPGESRVTFLVPDNRGGFSGHTSAVTGRVAVAASPDGETYTAQVTASVDAGALTTDSVLRDVSMRRTYLRTDRYPAITFAGTVTARPGLAVHPFPSTVRGSLTIRDVTREQTFSATVTALAHEFLVDASTSLRMADYGIPYPRMFIFAARDPVTVTLHIRAYQRL
jgi:polyisoprenoid-binding protein YceI